MEQLTLWYEPVLKPLDPRKQVHVVNHWRKLPNSATGGLTLVKDDSGRMPKAIKEAADPSDN
jgi:hypothetical protein